MIYQSKGTKMIDLFLCVFRTRQELKKWQCAVSYVSILFFTFTCFSMSVKFQAASPQLQCQSANLRKRSCSPLLQSMARLIGRPDTNSTDAFIIASKPPTSFFFVPCKSQAFFFLRRVYFLHKWCVFECDFWLTLSRFWLNISRRNWYYFSGRNMTGWQEWYPP